MQIGRQEKFHMGKIADNAEQQKYNNAAPQQKIFPFAALGEPLGIPQHPNQKCRQPAGECKNERCRSPDMPDR